VLVPLLWALPVLAWTLPALGVLPVLVPLLWALPVLAWTLPALGVLPVLVPVLCALPVLVFVVLPVVPLTLPALPLEPWLVVLPVVPLTLPALPLEPWLVVFVLFVLWVVLPVLVPVLWLSSLDSCFALAAPAFAVALPEALAFEPVAPPFGPLPPSGPPPPPPIGAWLATVEVSCRCARAAALVRSGALLCAWLLSAASAGELRATISRTAATKMNASITSWRTSAGRVVTKSPIVSKDPPPTDMTAIASPSFWTRAPDSPGICRRTPRSAFTIRAIPR
jgi:hypothetical protein